MAAPMPAVLALIVCRVVFPGGEDSNSAFTNWRNTEWDLSQGVMHCRRIEVQLYDPAVDQGAIEQPFNPAACMITAMKLGPQFDVDHRDKPWRFYRSACPVPIVRQNPDGTETIIDWKLPECPRKDGMIECETDSAI